MQTVSEVEDRRDTNDFRTNLKSYLFPSILLIATISGGFAGSYFGQSILFLKPISDIFLKLLFTAVYPLVFFSVTSAVTRMGAAKKLATMLATMIGTFIFTGVIAAVVMLIAVTLFPPVTTVLPITAHLDTTQLSLVPSLRNLFTPTALLPLILYALLIGIVVAMMGDKAKPVARFFHAGAHFFMKVISWIMILAPIGFFATFAMLVVDLGPHWLDNYLRATVIYYVVASLYFVAAFTAYAYLANKKTGVKQFWSNAFLPIMTSLATCSSAASIPANLQATQKMGVPETICDTVIPLGAVLHKDGSVLGGVLKIAFLFGVFHLALSGIGVWLTVIMISLLVGMVMGAIPSGGMLGEMLILSFYGFPPQTLIMIAAISVIIDPLATMLNVVGDSLCAMLVAKVFR